MKLQFEIGEMYTYKRLQQQIGENAKSWKGEAFEPLIQRREVIILRKEGLELSLLPLHESPDLVLSFASSLLCLTQVDLPEILVFLKQLLKILSLEV